MFVYCITLTVYRLNPSASETGSKMITSLYSDWTKHFKIDTKYTWLRLSVKSCIRSTASSIQYDIFYDPLCWRNENTSVKLFICFSLYSTTQNSVVCYTITNICLIRPKEVKRGNVLLLNLDGLPCSFQTDKHFLSQKVTFCYRGPQTVPKYQPLMKKENGKTPSYS